MLESKNLLDTFQVANNVLTDMSAHQAQGIAAKILHGKLCPVLANVDGE
jgi:hypothetical protein